MAMPWPLSWASNYQQRMRHRLSAWDTLLPLILFGSIVTTQWQWHYFMASGAGITQLNGKTGQFLGVL